MNITLDLLMDYGLVLAIIFISLFIFISVALTITKFKAYETIGWFLGLLGRLLWAAYVPVISVILALGLATVTQAQDVFLSTEDSTEKVLFVVALLFWSLIIHYSARISVNLNNSVAIYSERYVYHFRNKGDLKQSTAMDWVGNFSVVWFPRLLGFSCFVSVLYIIYRTEGNLGRELVPANYGSDAYKLADEKTLFLGTKTARVTAAAFIYVLFVTQRSQLAGIMPNWFGHAPEASAIRAPKPHNPILEFLLQLCNPLFNLLSQRNALQRQRLQSSKKSEFLTERKSTSAKITGPGIKHDLTYKSLVPDQNRAIQKRAGARIGLLVLVFFAILGLLLAAVDPITIAPVIRRMPMLILVIMAWVPFFTLISLIGNASAFPLVPTLMLALIVANATNPDTYEIKYHDKQVVNKDKPTLQNAIDLWKEKTCSKNSAGAFDCPRPIIMSVEGGASRAGFHVASLFGGLMDSAITDEHRLGQADNKAMAFSNRVFAITPISGGTTGSLMIAAALKRAHEIKASSDNAGDFTAPCLELSEKKNIGPWQDCLQQLMNGDFLTPTAAALALRDPMLPLVSRAVPIDDRARILERTWERHYSNVMGLTESEPNLMQSAFSDFYDHLNINNQDQIADNTPSMWVPIVFPIGASVGTGKRIILSPLQKTYKKTAPPVRPNCVEECEITLSKTVADKNQIFPQTLDFHDLTDKRDSTKASFDVAMSGAGTLSARFPLISPSGRIVITDDEFELRKDAVRQQANANGIKTSWLAALWGRIISGEKHNDQIKKIEKDVLNKIVDGGYYEAIGIATAYDLYQALVDKGLRPVILQVSNAPYEPKDTKQEEQHKIAPNIPDKRNFALLFDILDGVGNARSFSAEERLIKVQDRLNARGSRNFFHARIIARTLESSSNIGPAPTPRAEEMKGTSPYITPQSDIDLDIAKQDFADLSMSWWLSDPVQSYIECQVLQDLNDSAIWPSCVALEQGAKYDLGDKNTFLVQFRHVLH